MFFFLFYSALCE